MKSLIESIKNLDDIKVISLISAAGALRKEKALRALLSYSKEKKISSKKIYEALLQTYLFAGFPSALNSLKIYSELFSSPAPDLSQKNFGKIGRISCKKIYGNKFDKLIENVSSFSPELARWLIEEGYGKTLSRTGLTLRERELCIIPILSACKFDSQLYSHISGAFRQKASLTDIEEVIKNLQLLGSSSGAGFGMKVLSEYKKQKNKMN